MNALLLVFGTSLMLQSVPNGFPHAKHTRLFPVCEGCHAGIATGNTARVFPAAAECATCHDGTRRAAVGWTARSPRVSNLRFSHPEHRRAAQRSGNAPDCQMCHGSGGRLTHAEVGAAQPAGCMSCHAQKTETHLAATMSCNRCHVPLTRARAIALDDVARFPKPEWHGAADFLAEHGRGSLARNATCGVCHARETCERCHANADRLPQITALERDPRVAALESGKTARYYAPISHSRDDWTASHADDAAARTEWCANCHVQSSCSGCHPAGTARPIIARLPAVPMRVAGKLNVTRVARRVHAADMVTSHGSLAAANRGECTQCHTTQKCASCHAGMNSRAFHEPNYTERHAADVFGGTKQCGSCHSTETFCRSCHVGSGVAAGSRMSAAFHDGQPLWVLAHGQAARRGLDACAACHRQQDCVRCHSAAGGWGVNPHGPGFEAARIASRSTASCRQCHLSNPLKGN